MAQSGWRREMGRGFAFGLGFTFALALVGILLSLAFLVDRRLERERMLALADEANEQIELRRQAAEVRVALRSLSPAVFDFLVGHGRPPQSLEELLDHPSVEPQQIHDPFNSGRDLHFEYNDGAWLIASVGPDGRLTLPDGEFHADLVERVQRRESLFNSHTQETVLYDPTNGVRSIGDLLIIDHRDRYRRHADTNQIGTVGPVPLFTN